MLQHFGNFSGFRAHVSYLPERGVGVAVFANEPCRDSCYRMLSQTSSTTGLPVATLSRPGQRSRRLKAGIGLLPAVAEPFTQMDSIRVELAPPNGNVIVFDVDEASVEAATLLGYGHSFIRQ